MVNFLTLIEWSSSRPGEMHHMFSSLVNVSVNAFYLFQSDHSATTDCVIHSCAECGTAFRKKSSLERHMKIHRSSVIISTATVHVTKNESPITPSNKAHGAKVLENQEQPFSCTLCTRTYKFKHNLKVHEKSHKESSVEVAKPHKCPYCSKRFTKKFRLDLHVKKHQQVCINMFCYYFYLKIRFSIAKCLFSECARNFTFQNCL